jgi:hypothetical protein
MLYEVALYEPNPYERCHDVTRRFTVGSLRAAELAAESLLKPHAHDETWHSFRSARVPWVDISAYAKVPRSKDYSLITVKTVDPKCTIVPSVGELGYW